MPYVRKTSKPKKTYRRKARQSSKVSKKVKTYIKQTLARNEETKISPPSSISQFDFTSYNVETGAAGETLNLCDCLNLISQGTGQSNRIGNQIILKKLMVKFLFSPLSDNISIDGAINKTIKLIFFRVKKQMGAPTNAQWGQLFQNGNTNIPPSNQYLDIMMPFNKDLFEIKKTFTFKLNAIDNAEIQPQLNGHSFIKTISVDISRYLPKKIIYNDDPGLYTVPTNARLYAAVLIADSKGNRHDIGVEGISALNVNAIYNAYAEYTDA